MADSSLIFWGGGHLASLVGPHFKNSSSSSFESVVTVSRSSDDKHLYKQELANAVVLITRPFTHWAEERQEASTRKELEALSAAKRVVLVSSTGVFMHSESKTIESAEVNSGHPYIQAEKDLGEYCDSLVVLRAAGLYDDNKGPHLYYHRSGAVSGKSTDLLNLIHYNDLAKILQRVIEDVELQGLFNVSDNFPLTKAEVHEHLISWGSEWSKVKPPQDSKESDSTAAKRIDSSLIWKTLKLKPLFENFLHYTPANSKHIIPHG